MIISIERKQEELSKGETQMLSTEGGSFEEGYYVIQEEIIEPNFSGNSSTTRYLKIEDVDCEISSRQDKINKLNSELLIWQSLIGGTNE